MHSELQSRMGGRHTTTIIRKTGHYNHPAVHMMGHYNSPVKKLGHYNGISTIR
jgi:hypothetical protein